jgi:hypothetical protein
MAKRIRVVTAGDQSLVPRPIVIATDAQATPNPRLTPNEVAVRRYATTTTFGGFGRRTAGFDVMDSQTSQFYSPQLSSDFLEKPQNVRERRAFCRFFYKTNELVHRAIDIHTTLPLSKLRLVPPRGKNPHQNKYVMDFFEKMCDHIKLFRSLIEITLEYNLFGNSYNFIEDSGDSDEEKTPEQLEEEKAKAAEKSQYLEKKFGIKDANPNYKGWDKIIILPPDQVRIRKLPLTDQFAIEYVPDSQTKEYIVQGGYTIPGTEGEKHKISMPASLQNKVRQSGIIPLDTDPYTGSFCFHLARKKSQYEPMGDSMIECCINTLVLMDKLRQAQTSIASRHMTPMRIVWADQLNEGGVDNLREQVDLALVDPDYSIISNYEVHWEEMGTTGRLLDLTAENENNMSRLLSGLGVTKEVLTGEGTYTGSHISLEIMNTEYLLYREIIQDFVENYIFKPVAKKKGFVELDEYGNEVLLYPKLSFSRLAIRDNDRFFDAAYQLYQKGSISIDLILDILNIDPVSTKEKLEQDLFSVNDSMFNELLRNVYTNAATAMTEQTDVVEKLAKYLKLGMVEPEEAPPGSKRFSSEEMKAQALKLTKIMRHFKDHPELMDKVFSKLDKEGEKKS